MALIDDINRLFDELVRSPWSRQPTRPGPPLREETYLDLEMPGAGGPLGNVSVALHGRQLVVRARGRSIGGEDAGDAAGAREIERTFILPEEAEVSAIEAWGSGEVLHVRVRLHNRDR
jgi:HSP20 family molecular chaperone IbpA